MKVVAFMQNMWVWPQAVERIKAQIARDKTGQLRERLIAFALFRGCKTGRILKQAFGPALCDEIVWEEASPVIAGNPKDYFPPDVEHIKAVLAKHDPSIVLCLTMTGRKTIEPLCAGRLFLPCYHPCSRHPQTLRVLSEAAIAIRTKMLLERQTPCITS